MAQDNRQSTSQGHTVKAPINLQPSADLPITCSCCLISILAIVGVIILIVSLF